MPGSRLLIAIFAVCALGGAIGTAAADTDWAFAREWVGHYPNEHVAGHGSGLFAQTEIRRTLKALLPPAEAARLSALKVESRVKEIDGFLVADVCRPHDCPDDLATVVIDVQGTRLWVGLFTREAQRVSTRWYGVQEDDAALPDSVRKAFRARHGGQ